MSAQQPPQQTQGYPQPPLGPEKSPGRRAVVIWSCIAAAGLFLILAVVAIAAFVLWNGSKDESPAAPATTQTSPSPAPSDPTSEGPTSPPDETESPTPVAPPTTNAPSAPTPKSAEEAKAALHSALPEKIENWVLKDVGGDKIYKDGDRRISFLVISLSEDPSNPSEGREGEQVFERGSCGLNAYNPEAITCLIFPRAIGNTAYYMTSKYSDMEEMVRVSKAVIEGK